MLYNNALHRPATLLKKKLGHRCFPVNFAKLLKTSFFTEHLRWLLLSPPSLTISTKSSISGVCHGFNYVYKISHSKARLFILFYLFYLFPVKEYENSIVKN